MNTFADRLRDEMAYWGITRKELAHTADIKKRALDMYLGTQESMPPADVAVRLARALRVTVEYLVTGEEGSGAARSERPLLERELRRVSKETKQFLETAIHLFAEYESRP